MTALEIVSLALTGLIPGAIFYDASRRFWLPARLPRLLGALAVALVVVVPFLLVGWSRTADHVSSAPLVPVADWVGAFVDWLVQELGDSFSAVNDAIVYWIGVLERFLGRGIAWPLMIAIVAGISYHATRRLWLPVGVALALFVVWLLQLWVPTMQTLSLMIVAIAATVLVGLPLGVVMSRYRRFRLVMLPVLDLMQTMPSLVYLIPGVMLFGLGAFSAILATMVYAVPPLIRLTDLGIRQVDTEVTEAAISFGATRRQLLFTVQLPLALPSIMAGVNQAIMMALAMVVIASMIGVNGLGQEVLQGLMRQEPGKGFVAGLAIVVLAIVLDRITQAYGRPRHAERRE